MGTKNIKEALADETDILGHLLVEQGVDGIIGGFPCQDISIAGKRKGIQRDTAGAASTRSGLFWEMVKTVCMVRPRYWLMENVAELLNGHMGGVLEAVATCGYDAEWDCVAASTVGAPHHRGRIYILAYNGSNGGERRLPKQIQRKPEFLWCQNVRRVEDLPDRPDLYPSKLCRSDVRTSKRLHGIGNGNPPCVIRELTKGLA